MTLSSDNQHTLILGDLPYVTKREIFDTLYDIFLTKQKLEWEDLDSEAQYIFANLTDDIYCYVNKKR